MPSLVELMYSVGAVLGWTAIAVLLIGKKKKPNKLANIFGRRLQRVDESTYHPPRGPVKTPYGSMNQDQIDKILSNVQSVLAVSGAIYGVLFALIISEKASLAFSSWTFIIWCGWVLAILLRVGYSSAILVSDYHEWDKSKREATLFGASKFAKHSIYLLIPTASLVPLFALMPPATLDNINANFPWGQDVSLFLGIFSVAIVAFSFYSFLFGLEKIAKRDYADIYMYSIGVVWIMGLGAMNISPLEPTNLNLFGLYPMSIPSIMAVIWYFFLLFGFGIGWYIICGELFFTVDKVKKKLKIGYKIEAI